jgi:oxaloacetate decarboxylase (Na+ extruding) subunit alpha
MIVPIAATFDDVGFDAMEIMSTGFEKKLVRDLREDLWERIRLIRQRITKTPLRAIRGQYVGSFQITPKSIERLWYERMAAHGVRQVRISNSSNTAAGWRINVERCREVGIDPVVNLIYAVSPKHTDEYYAERARHAAKLKPFRICLKDPGGLLTPERTQTLVPAVLKNAGGITVEFHTHSHTGLGSLCCLEAIKLGIRHVNTAIPPLADSISNPSVLNVARNAGALGYKSRLDEDAIRKIEKHFTEIARREGLPIGAPAAYDAYQYIHQVPGGMLSNLRFQLTNAGLGHRMPEVLEEIGRVREDLGYPIMVTPYSQYVGVQATMNVVSGQRYKEVSDELILYASGRWGREEAESIRPEVRERILDRPRARELARLELPEPTLEELKAQFGGPGVSDDEMLLRYLAGADQVEAMRASGGRPRANAGLPRILEQLVQTKKSKYIHVEKNGMKLTLSSRG